jgi:hypothetical protein
MARPSKCSFGFSELEFLGHIAGRGVIKPVQDKVASIKHFPIPKTRKNVRSFLGLIGFYQKFIPNFADITVPLTDLTKEKCSNFIHETEESRSCINHPKRHN